MHTKIHKVTCNAIKTLITAYSFSCLGQHSGKASIPALAFFSLGVFLASNGQYDTATLPLTHEPCMLSEDYSGNSYCTISKILIFASGTAKQHLMWQPWPKNREPNLARLFISAFLKEPMRSDLQQIIRARHGTLPLKRSLFNTLYADII